MTTTLLCLALAIFSEARGEPLIGQEAVAHVVLNRAESRKLSVCSVIAEKGQFTWNTARYLKEVRTKAGGITHALRQNTLPVARKGWSTAVLVARKVLKRTHNMKNIEFFHAKYVNPAWGSRLTRVFVLGNHIFYSRKETVLASL